jgi:hypothetical protein
VRPGDPVGRVIQRAVGDGRRRCVADPTAQLPLCPGDTRTSEAPYDGYDAQPDRSTSNPPLVTKLVDPPGSVVEVVEAKVVDVVVKLVVVDGWNS